MKAKTFARVYTHTNSLVKKNKYKEDSNRTYKNIGFIAIFLC